MTPNTIHHRSGHFQENPSCNINQRRFGTVNEQIACLWLEMQGYVVLNRSFRCRFGEIDAVLRSPQGCIVFLEVKALRNQTVDFSPLQSIHIRKQKQIRNIARYWIMQSAQSEDTEYRFDALAIIPDFSGEALHFRHIPNAF